MKLHKSLLLVVDMQKGFLGADDAKVVVPTINRLVEHWQGYGWPIVYSRFVNLEGSNWERLRDWHELKRQPDTELADELTVDPTYVFKKSTYSAWSADTAQVCAIQGVQDVVIVGVDTNECVLATAISVFDAGLTPWLVEDACASNGGQEAHDKAIELLAILMGSQQIVSSTQILQAK